MTDLAGELIARASDRLIDRQCRVTLHFAVLLDTGEEVDTTRRSKPATFDMGDGSVLPGFESVLIGMKAGDDAQILIEAEDAFGKVVTKALQLQSTANIKLKVTQPEAESEEARRRLRFPPRPRFGRAGSD